MATASASKETRRLSALVASRMRHPNFINPDELTDLRRQYAESRLRDHITHIVASAPPLKSEQVDRLVALLVDGSEKRERVA